MAKKAWLEISILEAFVRRKYVTNLYYIIFSDFGQYPFLYKSTLKNQHITTKPVKKALQKDEEMQPTEIF